MSKIEQIQRYISRTNLSEEVAEKYCLRTSEISALYNEACRDMFSALCLAFNYGTAKGYRGAKAEVKRG